MKLHRTALFVALLLPPLGSACVSLDYDLSGVPVPISAKPETSDAVEVVPFRLEARNTLWVHGLAGHSEPDVAALVTEAAEGYDRIAGFRVSQGGNGHHWLLTHLSLTLVRMKRVVIEGQLVRERP